jgi:hypothetical protein
VVPVIRGFCRTPDEQPAWTDVVLVTLIGQNASMKMILLAEWKTIASIFLLLFIITATLGQK